MNDTKLAVAIVEISVPVQRRVWRNYTRGLLNDLAVTFAVVSFFVLGLVRVILALVGNIQAPEKVAVAVGCAAGILACSYLAVMTAAHFREVKSDLRAGKCEAVSVAAAEARAVDLPDGRAAVALNCGEHTLVIIGNWWKSSLRKNIEWSFRGPNRAFPATRFVLNRLPGSGVVVSINVIGERLRVKRGAPMEPELHLSIPKYMNAYWINRNLRELLGDSSAL